MKETTVGATGGQYRFYYIADTDAGKPVTGLNVGDLCWAVDTGLLYVATSATTWKQVIKSLDAPNFVRATVKVVTGAGGDVEFISEDGTVSTYLVRSGAQTASSVAALPLTYGLLVAVGDAGDPPAANSIGLVNKTAQVAAVTSTNLTNATPAGLYRISYYLRCTTAGNGTGDVTLNIIATDTIGAVTDSSQAVIFGSTASRDQGTFVKYLASGNITYTATISGTIGTSKYDLRIRAEYLG